MNKYQKNLLLCRHNDKEEFVFSDCAPMGEECKSNDYGSYDVETNCFTIKQDRDITKKKYVLSVSKTKYPYIAAVLTKKNDTYTDISVTNDGKYAVIADFDNKIDAIKLRFANNLADDFEFVVAFVEADRKEYEEWQKALLLASRTKRAAIKHSVGDSLINIYFQPCEDDCESTEISLFVPDKYDTAQAHQRKVLSWSLIMSAWVEKGMFFKSITGLAYGRYAYVVKQFDKNNQLLFSTDYVEFSINKPQPPVIEFGTVNVI